MVIRRHIGSVNPAEQLHAYWERKRGGMWLSTNVKGVDADSRSCIYVASFLDIAIWHYQHSTDVIL